MMRIGKRYRIVSPACRADIQRLRDSVLAEQPVDETSDQLTVPRIEAGDELGETLRGVFCILVPTHRLRRRATGQPSWGWNTLRGRRTAKRHDVWRSAMADIKLFRLTGETVAELTAVGHALERQLQTSIERNLEALLGIRFLASEYSTGPVHGGRIDTLGLDENDSPVIIEYKRSKSENVINQGLYYLDWLMDHRAEFEMMAMKQYGTDIASINWTGPRLVCIAQDFTLYDEHAVKQINRNIELVRYRRYGDEFLLFELVNATTATETPVSEKGASATTVKTVDDNLEAAPQELKDLYEDLRARLGALGDDVQEKHLKHYIAFKRLRNFVCVEIQPTAKRLLVFVKVNPDSVELEPGFTRDVRQIGHFGTGDLEISIKSQADLERAMPLLERSYEAS
jgi:predicted transport protein